MRIRKLAYLVLLLLPFLIASFLNSRPVKKINNFQDSLVMSVCPRRLPFFLPERLHESSGLTWFDSLLWTINDSGNDPVVFGFDLNTGKIRRSLYVDNATNVDWEEICSDNKWMYVGDFGNNAGSRHDLCIYRFLLDQITSDSIQHLQAEKIDFAYEDQHDFSSLLWKSAWDAEAMIPRGDSLYIFMKDWAHNSSAIYILPNSSGRFMARKKCKLNVDGLITASSFNQETGWLAFCGYNHYQPFLSIINIDSLEVFAYKPLPQILCDSMYSIQTEGITYYPGNKMILSCETSVIPACLFTYDEIISPADLWKR